MLGLHRAVDTHIECLRKRLSGTKPGIDPASSVNEIGYRYETT